MSSTKKYFILSGISCAITCGLALVLALILKNSILAFVVIICLLIMHILLVKNLSRKYIDGILYCNLDPERFAKDVLMCKWAIPSVINQINVAYFSGDYNTTIAICNKQLEKGASPSKRLQYQAYLAAVYFEIQNMDKLQEICNSVKAAVRVLKQKDDVDDIDKDSFEVADIKDKRKQEGGIYEYYHCYLNGEYDKCAEIIKSMDITQNIPLIRLREIQQKYYLAVAYYKGEQHKEAKELFEQIINAAPKLNMAALAKKYLAAIENGENIVFENELFSAQKYNVYEKTEKKRKILKIVNIVVCICLIALLPILFIKPQSSEYYKEINDALSKQYEQYSVVKCFNVEKGGQYIEALCVAVVEDEIKLFSIVESETEYLELLPYYDSFMPEPAMQTEIIISSKTSYYNHNFVVQDAKKVTDAPYDAQLSFNININQKEYIFSYIKTYSPIE